MKRLAILGSTGSIGKSTLDVIRNFPGMFRVEALCVHSNIEELARQIKVFEPRKVGVVDHASAAVLRRRTRVPVLAGIEGLEEIAGDKASDTLVMAVTGSAALTPLVRAVEAGKDICLANKEALVMAGPLIMAQARRHAARIMPVTASSRRFGSVSTASPVPSSRGYF
jgi:1-deoxy-D-xylulose-5-phosphate reductoisomerase